MSKIEHAKRVSKRLLKLAKTFPNNKIEVKNLSDAFKHIAEINGYKDWHDYQENLIRQDYIANNEIPKRDISNLKTFEPIYEKKPAQKNELPTLNIIQYTIQTEKQTPSKPIILGKDRYKKTFKPQKEHFLTEYPLLVSGSTGAGKSEALIALMAQYIANKEGCVYIDCKGSSTIYTSTLSLCHEYHKVSDLFVLNLCSTYDNSSPNKKKSNSIDPINPLIGSEKELKNLIGDFAGGLINEIGLELKEQSKGVNLFLLEQIISLPSLINLYNENTFQGKTKSLLSDYIHNILKVSDITQFNLNTETAEIKNNILKEHIAHFHKLKLFIGVLKTFPHVFSTEQPDISFNEIFAGKKVMCVLLPALEKSPSELTMISDIIMSQLYLSSKHFDNLHKDTIYQNVIIDDIRYNISNNISKEMMLNLPKSTNWIFGIQDFSDYNANNKIDFLISKCNTFAFMKCEDTHSIPDKLIGRILRNTTTNHHLFSNIRELRSMNCGEAWVFQNKTLEPIFLGYREIKPLSFGFIPN